MSFGKEPSSPSSGKGASSPTGGGGSDSCPGCNATVTIGQVLRGNPYVGHDATASGLPDSVPPTKTYEVQVTITWAGPACPGHQVDISIVNGSGDNGTATVAPAQLTASGTVTVTGGDQTGSGHGGQLKIRATLRGETKAESDGFTVCAHPLNWRDTMDEDIDTPDGVGMAVEDTWDSDSVTFADLDEAEIAEVVRLGPITSPPFESGEAHPLQTSDYLPADQVSGDTLQEPRPSAGPAATLVTEQLSIFKCHRCGTVDQVVPNSGMMHTDEVFQRGTAWFHRTVRVGAALTVGAYTVGPASSVNLRTGDHALH